MSFSEQKFSKNQFLIFSIPTSEVTDVPWK